MSQQFVAWIEGFLDRRELGLPDGRALYAYRCSQEEFDSLASLLANCPPFHRAASSPIRAFALYASEWWQREYDGGTWAWEPLLESIGWSAVTLPKIGRKQESLVPTAVHESAHRRILTDHQTKVRQTVSSRRCHRSHRARHRTRRRLRWSTGTRSAKPPLRAANGDRVESVTRPPSGLESSAYLCSPARRR